MAEDRYIRLNESLEGAGTIVSANYLDNKDTYKEAVKTYKFKTLFTWPKEAKEIADKNNGFTKAYQGLGWSNIVLLDFDSKIDLNICRNEIDELFCKLRDLGIDAEESVSVDFSGQKGFHVSILLDKELERTYIKNIAMMLMDGLGTVDRKIYDIQRKIRLRNSKHNVSGLYKIPITMDEFFNQSIDWIKNLAALGPRYNFEPKLKPADSAILVAAAEKFQPSAQQVIVDEGQHSDEAMRGLSSIRFDLVPPSEPKCIHAMLKGVMRTGQGERNDIFLALVRYLRNQNKTKNQIVNELKQTAKDNHALYPEFDPVTEAEIKAKVDSCFASSMHQVPGASGTSKDNDVIREHCILFGTQHKCKLHGAIVEEKSSIVNIAEVSTDFETFARDFEANTVKTGIKLIDDHMKIVTNTVNLVVAAPGVGKTSLALDVMEKTNQFGFSTMFFSMDMYKNLVFLKIAQKLTNYGQDEILKFYRNGDKVRINEIKEAINSKYNNAFFDFSKTLSLDMMKQRVQEANNTSEKPVKLVIVDYAGRVSGPYSDVHANATFNAMKSVEIAEDTKAAWIFLSQVSRNMGDGSTPLRSKRAAKDSGGWEEAASNVITLWRPFLGMASKDDIMRIFLAKNRMGPEIERPLWWNGRKGSIIDMSDNEYDKYTEERSSEESEIQKGKRTFI